MERVTVSISGRLFDVERALLARIPFFADAPTEDAVYLCRSAIGFEHVLGYLTDAQYPFPADYAYELDFYGLPYATESLIPSNRALAARLVTIEKQLVSLREEAAYLAQQNTLLGGDLREVALNAVPREFRCNKKDCTGDTCVRHNVLCSDHRSQCIHPSCSTETKSNFCPEHANVVAYCRKKGCGYERRPDSPYCFRHLPK